MTSGIDPSEFDPKVRPQDDLFGHVNGRWAARTEIPSDRGRYGVPEMLAERAAEQVRALIEEVAAGDAAAGSVARKVGDLYASFMDEATVERLGLTPLADQLALVDGATSPAEVFRLLGQLGRNGVDGLVHLIVDTDHHDPDRYVVYLEQAGLGLPDESYYREDRHADLRAAYVRHVEAMLGLAGGPDPAAAAARVMTLETRLAAAHWDRVTCRDVVRCYNRIDRAQLAELTPDVDWAGFLEGRQAPATAFDAVVARQPSFLTAMAEALAHEPLESWRDWLRWRVVHAFAPYLSSVFVEANFDFYGRTLSGVPEVRERWKRGVSLVEQAVGEAVGQLYVERYFPPRARDRMVRLVDTLVEAFRRAFADVAWMGDRTRSEALAKLEAFTAKIGYPDVWRDYSTLEVDPADLVGNVRRASAFEVDRHLRKLGGPVDRSEWFMTPQTVNAYYNPGMNEIVFPAGILQPPYFDVDADEAVNYGGIGAIIGHEIGHGFDDQGSRYDGTGRLRNWWTDDDRARFGERVQALITQFSALEPREAPGNRVNGALTVGENIGDLGGLTIAYYAYRIATAGAESPMLDGLTGDQRFFIGWARAWRQRDREAEARRRLTIDPHSPADLRANTVRNLLEFHAAFGVQEGDGMWLPDGERVRIF